MPTDYFGIVTNPGKVEKTIPGANPPTPPPGTKAADSQVAVYQGDSNAVEQFLAIGPGDFSRAYELSTQQDLEEAWNQFVMGAGIDVLGVPTNWWPGLHASNDLYSPYQFTSGYGPYADPTSGHIADPYARQESWAAADRYYTFINADDTTQQQQLWVRYDPTRGAQQYMLMGRAEREKYSTLLADSGLLAEEWSGIGDYAPDAAAAFSTALSWANYWGTSVDQALTKMGGLYQLLKKRRGGGGGGAGPTYKVEVPDYETLVQKAKDLIQSEVGDRDVADWEMAMVADEFQRQYGSWADATKARMMGGNGTYEIPDPEKLTQSFVEDKYADEISRLSDIGDTRQMNQLLISAATRGTAMMGGIANAG